MMKLRLNGGLMGCFLFALVATGAAQTLRDPTIPPAEAGAGVTLPGGPKSPASTQGPMSVIVRNGKAYVMVGTRLYAVGQKLGQARIERISETEIWLREDGVLRKVPQFAGIQRRIVTGIAPSVVSQ